MKKMVLLAAVLLLAITAGSAFAKDICVMDEVGSLFQFNNVKLLKGKTTLLAGRFHLFGGATNVPVSGSVTLDSDGVTTRIGVTAYPVAGAIIGFFDYVTGDKDFNATGFFDNIPFSGNDGATTWTNVDCKSVVPAASAIFSPQGPAAGRP